MKAIIVFMDEAGFSLHPKLRLVWAKKGSKPKVLTASKHQQLNWAGWVAPWVSWHGLTRIDKGNTDAFLLFLKYLHKCLKDFTVYLYADGPYWHKGERVREALKRYPNIHLEYLPSYHPELNPQERIGKLLRYEVTTNRYFPDIEAINMSIRKNNDRLKITKSV